jgi:ferredoxin
VLLLLASPFFLQTQNIFEYEAYGQVYNIVEIKDSKEATEEEEEAMEEAKEEDDNN